MIKPELLNEGITKPPIVISIKDREEPLHWHDDLELYLVINGQVTIIVNNLEHHLSEGEFIIINCEDVHRVKAISYKHFVMASYSFDLSFFNNYISYISTVIFSCKRVLPPDKLDAIKTVRRILAQLLLEISGNYSSNDLKTIQHGISILKVLNYYMNCINKPPEKFRHLGQYIRVWQIFEYIYSNYHKRITLADLAKHTYINESYMSHFIKQNIGLSYLELLHLVRAESSIKLLLTTNKSIAQISQECGFSDPKYYYRYFKKYFYCNPTEYRKENKSLYKHFILDKNQDADQLLDSALIKKVKSFISESNTVKQSSLNYTLIECSTRNRPSQILDHSWQDYLYTGDVSTLLNRYYHLELLEEIQEEIYFKYIIVNNFIEGQSKEIKPLTAKNEFDKIWPVLDLICRLKSKPLIEMPITCDSDQKIKRSINRFVTASIERYGMKNVQNWRYFKKTNNPLNNQTDRSETIIRVNESLDIKIEIDGFYDADTTLHSDKSNNIFAVPLIIKEILFEKNKSIARVFDDSRDQSFCGSNGLLTSRGLKKPVYYAYYLLARLGEMLIQNKDNYIITRSEKGMQILFYNFPIEVSKNINHGNFHIRNNGSSFQPVFPMNCQNMLLRVFDLEKGNYLVKRFELGQNRGNIFDHLSNSECMQSIPDLEIEKLNRSCFPRLTYEYKSNATEISVEVSLEEYCAVMIIVERANG